MGLQNPLNTSITTTGATDSIDWPGGWGYVVLTGSGTAHGEVEYSPDGGSNWATKTTLQTPQVVDFRLPPGHVRLNVIANTGTTSVKIDGY